MNIFKLKINDIEVRDKHKLNLDIPKWNQKTFVYKSLKVLVLKSGTIYNTMVNPLKILILDPLKNR